MLHSRNKRSNKKIVIYPAIANKHISGKNLREALYLVINDAIITLCVAKLEALKYYLCKLITSVR